MAKSARRGWWIFFIWVFTFTVAVLMTLAMSNIMRNANILVASLILLIILFISIIFDIIGIAVTAADQTPFNSMAARKVYGAKTAIWLIKNADRVSNFCSDVIGDVCGIVSGAAIAYIFIKINEQLRITGGGELYIEALLGGFVAALTVGGKSFGKKAAINGCNAVVYRVAVVVNIFRKKK